MGLAENLFAYHQTYVFKIIEKNSNTLQKEKELITDWGRHCARKYFWHKIVPKLLDYQRGIITKYFRWLGCFLIVAGSILTVKSRFKCLRSSQRWSNENWKFWFLFCNIISPVAEELSMTTVGANWDLSCWINHIPKLINKSLANS